MDCLQTNDQTFWLQATIVTTENNPQMEQFIHPDAMTCMDPHAIQNGLGSFLIQLTEEDIQRRCKM